MSDTTIDEPTFDRLAAAEIASIEDKFEQVDPDEVEASSSDGVLMLELKDGVRVVLNTQRPTRQLWLAAVASAWRFDYDLANESWITAKGEELRATIRSVVKKRIGLELDL